MNHNIAIISCAPQMPENVGAIARCMKNFSLYDLRIVAPQFSWPDAKALANCAGADDVLGAAKVCDSLQEAICDLTYLYACSARKRYMNKEYVLSKSLAEQVKNNIAQGHKIGILFGREASGLSNAEVNLCNKILVIDNNQAFSSLNIAQAVCIVAYELFAGGQRLEFANLQQIASKEELNHFLQHLMAQLEGGGFFQVPEKKAHMIQNVQNIFTRIEKLSTSEINILWGIVAALTRKSPGS